MNERKIIHYIFQTTMNYGGNVIQFHVMQESEKAGYDIGSYRDAPDGLRVWCGATVDKKDLQILTQWIDWAYHTVNVQNILKINMYEYLYQQHSHMIVIRCSGLSTEVIC